MIKFLRQLNWAYIFGEILLLFVGISLAIWFNNWNSSRILKREKANAFNALVDEIQANLEELRYATKSNADMAKAFEAFNWYSEKWEGEVVATPDTFKRLMKDFPSFFSINDSIPDKNGKFRYRGGYQIAIELTELTEIAWKTTQDIGLAKTFEYDCLYKIETAYNLQRLYQKYINKAADALQKKDLKELVNTFSFVKQVEPALEEEYLKLLKDLNNCG